MGSGSLYSMKETDDTRAASAAMAFDKILEKVLTAGGEITLDESAPLYTDIGMEEYEVGSVREVEFSLAGNDFKMIRDIETHRLSGAGRHKSLEKMEPPRSTIKLLKKPQTSQDWQHVDLDDFL